MLDDAKTLFDWCLSHWSFVAFVLACFVQVTPIFKANPITSLFRWIGKLLTADLMAEIKKIKDDVAQQRKEIEENERDRIRYEILDFANSCRHGRKHTKDEFEHIITLNKKYERLMQKIDEPNGVYTEEFKYIMELYHMCQRENKFLA